jgi:hypothetical protein
MGSTTTKSVAGGGAWMIAAALQVIPNTWPNLLRPHPWAVAIFVIIGAAMFGYAAFGHKQPSGPITKQESHGDNSPIGGSGDQSVTAGRDVKQINAEHYYEATPAPPLEPNPAAKPRIAISKPQLCNVIWNRMLWQIGETKGTPGTVVWIDNLEGEEGASRGDAHAVSVVLTFKENGNVIAKVPRAYWINHIDNEISIESGYRFAVLIGTFYGLALKVYENTKEPDRSIRLSKIPFGSSVSVPVLRETLVPVTSLVEIKLAVLSEGKTLADGTFNCVKNADNSLTIV